MGVIGTAGPVLGVGYEGREIMQFVADLTAAGVDVLVDVRLTPVSRKRGFSKRALCEALTMAGIAYRHLPALGNPKPNRAGFAGPATELMAARDRYAALLDTPDAQSALDQLAARGCRERVAVMCFEADEERCHRHVVLAEVYRRLDRAGLPV